MKKFFGIMALIILCAGCAPAAGTSAANTPASLQTRANAGVATAGAPSDTVENFEQTNESTSERAERVAQAVTALNGIDTASVVISGDTAIVGIQITGALDDARLIKLKGEVEKEALRTDGGLTHVAVTASAELVKRVTNMSDAVAGDHESGSDALPNEQAKDIVRSLTPPV